MSSPETQTTNRGRPTKYKPEHAKVAKKLCERGATDAELAEVFDVTTVTIWRWQVEHEDFCNALKAGKEIADDRVERSLYQRAVGYSFNTEKLFSWQGCVTRAATVEHVPPDPGAAMNWLTNRRPDQWRSKQSLEHTGKDGKDLIPSESSPRDLARAVLDILRNAPLADAPPRDDEMESAGSPSAAAPTTRARAPSGASASTGAASGPEDRPGNLMPRLSPKRKTISRKGKK